MPPENDDFDEDDFEEHFDEGLSEPPHGVRFGDGQPINRAGRPRGSPNLRTMVKRVAMQRHKVIIDGKSCRKSTLELILLSLRKKAAEVNIKAFKLQQSLLQEFAPRQQRRFGVLITSAKLTCDEWEAVYGSHITDEEVAERLPYVMREQKAHQEYMANRDRQFQKQETAYKCRN